MNKQYTIRSLAVACLLATGGVQAGSLTLPNNFSAGTKAVAAEVNDNFSAVKTAVDDNDSRLATLEASLTALQSTVTAQAAAIADLQSQLATVTTSNAMALDPYLTVTSDSRGPLVRISGANVQVVNGMGYTGTTNGLGNLIVGYDESDSSGIGHCELGTDPADTTQQLIDENACTNAGYSWRNTGFKTGSHYLVVGAENNYTRWGGLLVGLRNTSNFDYASAVGGIENSAGGMYSNVFGGWRNSASGEISNVLGGWKNSATDQYANVSGGSLNIASGFSSNVSGGMQNTAGEYASSILGGNLQTATSSYQTIPALP